jgi:hypothetical protein
MNSRGASTGTGAGRLAARGLGGGATGTSGTTARDPVLARLV